jgi:Ca2+-binding RTX toxin-like protein
MTTFHFETITAAQALAITSADTVILGDATPISASVLYDTTDPDVTVIAGAHTVVFGAAVETLSMVGGLHGADGSTLFIGDASLNSFTAGATNDALFGGGGDDALNAGEGNNLLQGNAGSDLLTGGAGNDTIYGGQDNDQIHVGDGVNFGQGNKGDDNIIAGLGANTLLGGQGDDTITAGAGPNFLNGNLGDDVVHAGGGNDQVFGEDGNDTLNAGDGDSFVDGGDGDDSIAAGLGSNTISGGNGDDTISSQSARVSQLDGGAGDDQIFGAGVLTGGDGNDTLNGHAADGTFVGVTLNGGVGDDLLKGSNENDSLSGGDGNDTLNAGQGNDTMSGGLGSDLFQFASIDARIPPANPSLHDSIIDWSSADQLQFGSGGAPNNLSFAVAGTAQNYAEFSAPDFITAFNMAVTQMAAGKAYVAAQVGSDVIVFADMDGAHDAQEGVFLVGRSLTDIDFGNIVRGTG